MVQKGLEFFYVGLADNMYAIGYHPPGHNETNGTTSEIFIYEMNTHTYDPYKSQGINDFRGLCLIVLVVAAFIYAFVGASYVVACIVGAATMVDSVLGRSTSYRNMRIKEYFENLLVSICVIAFTDLYISAILAINFIVVSFLMVGLLTSTTISTFAGNGVLYLAMATAYVSEFAFMIARAILIFMFAAVGRLIGVLLISNKTRSLGISIVYYFTGIVFLQTIIVAMTTAGYLAIEALSLDGMINGEVVEAFAYVILILILIGTSLVILIGLVRMKRTALTAVKMVI